MAKKQTSKQRPDGHFRTVRTPDGIEYSPRGDMSTEEWERYLNMVQHMKNMYGPDWYNVITTDLSGADTQINDEPFINKLKEVGNKGLDIGKDYLDFQKKIVTNTHNAILGGLNHFFDPLPKAISEGGSKVWKEINRRVQKDMYTFGGKYNQKMPDEVRYKNLEEKNKALHDNHTKKLKLEFLEQTGKPEIEYLKRLRDSKKEKENDPLLKKFKYGGTIGDLFSAWNKRKDDPIHDYNRLQNQRIAGQPNYIDSPTSALHEHNRMVDRSLSDMTNPLTDILDLLGGTGMNVGSQLISQGGGLDGLISGFGNMRRGKYGAKGLYALGGQVPIEVEGDEMAETPQGDLINFQGPDHEQGGIPTSLPEGSDIFSKRIEVDGLTMAERKELREKRQAKAEKNSEKIPYDPLARGTLERTQEIADMENEFDLNLQDMISEMLEDTVGLDEEIDGDLPIENLPMAALGQRDLMTGFTKDLYDNLTLGRHLLPYADRVESIPNASISSPEVHPTFMNFEDTDMVKRNSTGENSTTGDSIWNQLQSALPTTGEMTGWLGNLYQANKISEITDRQRAGDIPNINAMKDYGKNALNTIRSQKEISQRLGDTALRELGLSRNAASERNRANARGINTSRALDLATDAGINKQMSDNIMNQFTQMAQILGQEANQQNAIDQAVMQGEKMRDTEDRQDRGSYMSNLITAEKNKGKVLSQLGTMSNKVQERNTHENLINSMSDYVQMNIRTGKMTATEGVKALAKEQGMTPKKYMEKFEEEKRYEEYGYTKETWKALPETQKERVATGQVQSAQNMFDFFKNMDEEQQKAFRDRINK